MVHLQSGISFHLNRNTCISRFYDLISYAIGHSKIKFITPIHNFNPPIQFFRADVQKCWAASKVMCLNTAMQTIYVPGFSITFFKFCKNKPFYILCVYLFILHLKRVPSALVNNLQNIVTKSLNVL